MARNSNVVTVAAKLIGGSSIVRESDRISGSIRGMGKATDEADAKAAHAGKGWELFSKKTREAEKHSRSHHSVLKSVGSTVASYGGGLLAAYGAFDLASGSLGAVKQSGQELIEAQRLGVTGSSKETLVLLGAYKARGLGISNLTMQAKTLSKAQATAIRQEESYARASAKAAAEGKPLTATLGTKAQAFKALGIEAASFAKLSGAQQLQEVNEKLSALPPGMEKTRLATELFGRSGTALLPLLEKGPLGFKALKQTASEMLPSFKGGNKEIENMEASQAKLSLATEGLKLKLGMALLPVVIWLSKTFTKLYQNIQNGKGVWGAIDKVVSVSAEAFKGVAGWIGRTKGAAYALAGMLGILAGAWAVSKVINFAKGIGKIFSTIKDGMGLLKSFVKLLWEKDAAEDASGGGGGAGWLSKLKSFGSLGAVGRLGIGVAGGYAIAEAGNRLLGSKESVAHKLLGADTASSKEEGAFSNGYYATLVQHAKERRAGALGRLKAFDKLHDLPDPPGLWTGGTVLKGGSVVVGERGPELLSLPSAARVDPLRGPSRFGVMPQGTYPGSNGDTIVSVQIDKREIGRAVVKQLNLENARMA